MSYVEIARDFFTAHLDKHLLQRINLNTLKLESTSYLDEAHKNLRSDILYSVQIDNQLGYLYLLVEHQSRVDALMGFRLLQYACRIWQAYLDSTKPKPKKLPVLIPLVMYNGKVSPYSASTRLLDCFHDANFIEEFLFGHFKLIDLTVIPDEELAQHRRAALMELLEKHIRIRDMLPIIKFMREADVLGQIKDLGSGRYLQFAVKYVVDKGEANQMDEAVDLLIEQVPEKRGEIMTIAEGLIQRGMQQGMQQGEQQKAQHIAENLLRMGIEPGVVAQATEMDEATVRQLAEQLA